MLESVFQPLSDTAGLPLDQVRYIFMLFASYPVALVFRHILHPSHTPLPTRHMVSAFTGLGMATICFDWQVLWLVAVVAVSYVLLLTLPPQVVQRYTMVWVMGCMSIAHLYRTMTDYGGYHLDVTGPLMVLVQKLSLVAFAVHDGQGNPGQLNDDQKKQKLDSPPSLLEYMSYCFNFHSLLAGPSVTIREHLAFMDGSNFRVAGDSSVGTATLGPLTEEVPKEPSALYPVVSKLLLVVVAGVVFLMLSDYDISLVIDPGYDLLERLVYSYLVLLRIRCRFYFIWILTDSVSNTAGLGFEGHDRLGGAKWGLASNVRVLDTELAMHLRTVFNSWNVRTSLWLRRVCYERVTWHPTLQSFVLSAWWHGFYPGYYCCFVSHSLSGEAAKKMRRLINPYFTSHGLLVKWSYHVVTLVLTHIYLDFNTLPFVLMWLPDIWIFWKYYYFVPLVTVLAVLFLLPGGRSRRQAGREGGQKGEEEEGTSVTRGDTKSGVKSEKQD